MDQGQVANNSFQESSNENNEAVTPNECDTRGAITAELQATPTGQATPNTGETTSEGPIRITEGAAAKISEIMAAEGIPGGRLRIKVVGGGCAGFAYDLAFDELIVLENGIERRLPAKATDFIADTDIAWNTKGVALIIDQLSLMYLVDTEISYVDTLQGAGFKFSNPNVSHVCGCQKSFSV